MAKNLSSRIGNCLVVGRLGHRLIEHFSQCKPRRRVSDLTMASLHLPIASVDQAFQTVMGQWIDRDPQL